MNSGPSGFQNAPITKAIIISSAGLSLAAGSRGVLRHLSLTYAGVFQRFELWRSFTGNLVFASLPEMIFGLYLLYFFRMFERRAGSSKFGVFVIFSTTFATLLQIGYLLLLQGGSGGVGSSKVLAPGPFALIFSLFVPFFLDVPVSTHFSILGLRLSDKSFVYLSGLQLLLPSWKSSLFPSFVGLLAGSIYRLNIFGIRQWMMPDVTKFGPVRFIMNHMRLPRSSRVAHPQPAWRASGGSASQDGNENGEAGPREPRMERFGGGDGRMPAGGRSLWASPPSREAVETLMGMGFDHDEVVRALVEAQNDVNVATNLLLEWRGL
ncbi:hypothetical protein CBR_g11167 [Chara braunii]|uniref:UBA domain-containing protein n=1 Tax=Chara braunii TaxID=69332 RepID=A0A388KQD1_CHABU|nr:hypothetical protein CBR_g11167 [Chara braunii]|eukprot:GBG72237.1 hypothetical protein CBR_g11167 [Chara braunii]